MRNYECTLVFSPEEGEEQIQQLLGELAGFLQEKGALLGKQWARREGKERVGVLGCTIAPEVLPEIEQWIRGKKEVKRFMIGKALVRPVETPVIVKSTVPQTTIEEKVSIEDIDKKLEEIFKTTL